MQRSEKKGKPNLAILFIYNMPLRAISKVSKCMVSAEMVDDILMIFNGHSFRGLGRLLVDTVKNIRNHRTFLKKLE
jgi:beta-glucosidase